MAMNYARFKSTLSGLSSIAQKVYECVPEANGWTHGEIYHEMTRKNYHVEYRIMKGCVNTLIDCGLVREMFVPGGRTGVDATRFKREHVRGRPATPLDKQTATHTEESTTEETPTKATLTMPTPTPTPSASKNPVDQLGDLAARARKMIAEINQLAADIDSAALATQEFVEKNEATVQKARQLQALLKESLT